MNQFLGISCGPGQYVDEGQTCSGQLFYISILYIYIYILTIYRLPLEL